MARIRTVKPEFFTSEDILQLSPMARLLYIGIWCEADREGRLAWKPNTLKIRYLPADNVDINALCDELLSAGLVVTYGDDLAFVPSFPRHQHINPRESASIFPDPDEENARVTTRQARVSDAQVGRKGKEVYTDASEREGEQINFDLFWGAYPRKQGKQDAEKAFKAAKLKDAVLQTILQDLKSRSGSDDWRKEGGKYIPLPATYLRGQRWLDEPVAPAATQPSHPVELPNGLKMSSYGAYL